MRRFVGYLLGIMICLLLVPLSVHAEESGGLTVTGVEENDVVKCYQIASYHEGSGYQWNDNVSKWILTEWTEYASLTPDMLMEMADSNRELFCNRLLVGVDRDELNEVNLPVNSKTGSTFYNFSLDKGLYLILPEGFCKVYDIALARVTDSKPAQITYVDSMYSVANVSSSTVNMTENRGTTEDGDTWTLQDDVVKFEGKVTFPNYPSSYSQGKIVTSIFLQIPEELDYISNSLTISGAGKLGKGHAVLSMEDVVLYEDGFSNILFFESKVVSEDGQEASWFYGADGIILSRVSLEDALTKYNEKYETTYVKETIIEQKNSDVFIVSIDSSAITGDVAIAYKATKNAKTSQDGIHEMRLQGIYSTSPINSNKLGYIENISACCSYGIYFTVCSGEDVEDKNDGANILHNAKRLQGVEFKVFAFSKSFPVADVESLKAAEEALGDREYYTAPTEDGENIKLYELVKNVWVDENGEASIGGLRDSEYLIMESTFPYGFEYTRTFLIIGEDDWTNETYMEGNYTFDSLWLNYPGLYLPNTGSSGTRVITIIGCILCVTALFLLAKRWGLVAFIRGDYKNKSPKGAQKQSKKKK